MADFTDAELDALMAWHKANPETLEQKARRIADAYTWDRPALFPRGYDAALDALQTIYAQGRKYFAAGTER